MCKTGAPGDFDFGPWHAGFKRRDIPDHIHFVGPVVDGALDFIQFGFGHIVSQREACHGNQRYRRIADFAVRAPYPKGWNTDAAEMIQLCFFHQPVDLTDGECRIEIGMFDKSGDVHGMKLNQG